METVEELVEFLERALNSRARGRVVDTGEAWSIVRREGVIPDDAPGFRPELDSDLAEYGFALLDAGLALNALERGHALARSAFAMSGRTFENLVRNGVPDDPRRGFHRVMAAAAYHLGSYAAIAYALFRPVDAEEQNLNTAEICLVRLMLRDLDGVRETAKAWLLDGENQDNAISERLQGPDDDRDAELALILISCVCRALANYEFALRTGVSDFVTASREILSDALALAAATGMASLWWVIRLTLGLLDDLWNQSLHMVLPSNPPEGALEAYANLRTVFIASLFARDVAEIELWPSQTNAARRAADPADDLVVALPTSAGKTRIAELATYVDAPLVGKHDFERRAACGSGTVVCPASGCSHFRPRACMVFVRSDPNRLLELQGSASKNWFFRPCLTDRLPLLCSPSCPHSVGTIADACRDAPCS